MLEDSILFRRPNPENWGAFILSPAVLVSGTDRCDNGNYGPGVMSTKASEYRGTTLISTVREVVRFEVVADFSPHCFITFIQINSPSVTSNSSPLLWKNLPEHPSKYWMGKSLAEFLRLIWEWWQVSLPPFDNDDNPALVARAFFENFDIPDFVLSEISSLPSMFISKYLLGDENARQMDSDYPDISQETKQWAKDLFSAHPYTSVQDRI